MTKCVNLFTQVARHTVYDKQKTYVTGARSKQAAAKVVRAGVYVCVSVECVCVNGVGVDVRALARIWMVRVSVCVCVRVCMC